MNNAQATYLDGLRGFAAQLVLLGHIYSLVLFPGSTLGLGDLGVIVFFILSGFLITYTSLLKKKRSDYSAGAYFSDRFFRIFVPYVPAVFFIVSLDYYIFNYTDVRAYLEYFNIKNFIATLTMFQQYPIGIFMDKLMGIGEMKLSTVGSARPLWTVASEWWLYVLFGMALFYRKNPKYFPLLLVIFVISSVGPLFNSVAGTGQGLSLVWLLMSILAYFYYQGGKKLEENIAVFLETGGQEKLVVSLSLGCVLILMVTRVFWTSYVETGFVFDRPVFYDFNLYLLLMAFLSALFIILSAVDLQERNRAMVFLADFSYSLYLIHYTWIFFILSVGWTTGNGFYDLILCYVSSNLIAIVFWWLFERNHRRVKLTVTRILLSRR